MKVCSVSKAFSTAYRMGRMLGSYHAVAVSDTACMITAPRIRRASFLLFKWAQRVRYPWPKSTLSGIAKIVSILIWIRMTTEAIQADTVPDLLIYHACKIAFLRLRNREKTNTDSVDEWTIKSSHITLSSVENDQTSFTCTGRMCQKVIWHTPQQKHCQNKYI